MNLVDNLKTYLKASSFLLLLLSNIAMAQTGDTTIDSWLSGFSLTQGGSSAPTLLNPTNYPNGPDKCNSGAAPIHEPTCPSDLLYTPNANTGGYQAFGVGVNLWEAGDYWYVSCYYYYVYNSYYDIWEPVIFCDYYSFTLPEHTFGLAAARIKFGSNTISSPWGSVPMSTLAFKAAVNYSSQPSVNCDTDFNGVAAPCDTSDENVYVVPSAGYEDKILIEDLNCLNPIRTGTSTDAGLGCFTHDDMSWATNLPAAYIDTTYSDTPSYYVPGMGSAFPFLIIENQTYFWWTEFYQLNLEPTSPHVIKHNASVTTRIEVPGFFCNSEPELCYFNVDQTTIGQ